MQHPAYINRNVGATGGSAKLLEKAVDRIAERWDTAVLRVGTSTAHLVTLVTSTWKGPKHRMLCRVADASTPLQTNMNRENTPLVQTILIYHPVVFRVHVYLQEGTC